MTFTKIRQAVQDYCNLSSDDAKTRVGEAINRHYRRITAEIGLNTTRFVTRSTVMTVGVRTVLFENIEKIDRVIDTTTASIRPLKEVSIDEQRMQQPGNGSPCTWAFQNTSADSVIILTDTIPQVVYSLQADGWTTLADIHGNSEPAFPASFHDVLLWYVVAEELLKKEKDKLAKMYEAKADKLLNELRFALQDSHSRTTIQGQSLLGFPGGGGGGGGGNAGGSAYTQTSLLTFDLGAGVAPFAVAQSTAPYVANLGAEFLGNIATDRLIGRDTSGTGETQQLTVSGGLEWTGSGGIQRSALVGDVTAAAGGVTTTIGNLAVTTAKIADGAVTTAKLAADAVTYATMQNVSAASKLLGRGSASGAGDPEEITIGANLAMSATTLGVTAAGSTTELQYNNAAVLGGATGLTWTSGSSLLTAPGAMTLGGVLTVTSGQVVFPGTANPSSGVNTLDEYEEGTWTPADGSGAALSLASVVGHYVKIGQLVNAWFTFTYPTTANGSDAKISGLPFTSITSTANGGATIALTSYSATVATIRVDSNATTASFFQTSGAALTNANLTDRTFTGVFVYRAAA